MLWTTAAALLIVGCGGGEQAAPKDTKATDTAAKTTGGESKTPEPTAAPAKVKTTDTVVGKGAGAAKGDILTVLYRGTLASDGSEFDSNMKPDSDPFVLRLGDGMVIPGWEQGLEGMKAGGKRRLEIPYALAYGDQGSPPKIPARADLVFEVELLGLVKQGEEGIYDKKTIKEGTGPAIKKGDKVKIHYVGSYLNGKQFDSSRTRNQPLDVTVGSGGVIPGMDDGLIGMRKGGKYELIIPPGVAYGAGGRPPIPGNMTLKFEIEVVSIN